MKKKFLMSFWNYTDAGVLDEEQAAKDWKELGMTVVMSSEWKKGQDKSLLLTQMDEAHKQGLQVIVCDERTHWRNLAQGESGFIKDVEEAVADFGRHPAFYAFFVGDEPSLPELENAIRAIRLVNEKTVAMLNFLPTGDEPFITDYRLKDRYDYERVVLDAVQRSGIASVAYDNYSQCYLQDRKRGWELYFDNLKLFYNVAKATGKDMWTSLLSVGHWNYRIPTEDDFRWQISTAVAHGAKGIYWFYLYARYLESSYRNSPIDMFYKRTETFNALRRQINTFMRYFADRFANATLIEAYHYGTVYGKNVAYIEGVVDGLKIEGKYGNDLIISRFSAENGEFIAVVNNAQDAEQVERVTGVYNGKAFGEWLAPGQLIILE